MRLTFVKDRTPDCLNLGSVTQLLPAAVLWDMDGTLVDTEPYWLAAEAELVSEFGGLWSQEDGLTLVGSGLWRAATILQSRGVALTEDEIIVRLTDRVLEQIEIDVPWRPGSLELLAELRSAGIPTALVTMSIRRMAEYVTSRIPGLPQGAFDYVIAGDSVTNSKPHPEAYLLAAELLGVDATDCVAIEDSSTGIASAVASGAVSIGVPLHVPLEVGNGYTIWPTLVGRGVSDIAELFSSVKDSEKEDVEKTESVT